MEEISVRSQWAKIRSFEKGFYATHLINIGAELGVFEALYETKEGLTVAAIRPACMVRAVLERSNAEADLGLLLA